MATTQGTQEKNTITKEAKTMTQQELAQKVKELFAVGVAKTRLIELTYENLPNSTPSTVATFLTANGIKCLTPQAYNHLSVVTAKAKTTLRTAKGGNGNNRDLKNLVEIELKKAELDIRQIAQKHDTYENYVRQLTIKLGYEPKTYNELVRRNRKK
jgi:hypothetical protein